MRRICELATLEVVGFVEARMMITMQETELLAVDGGNEPPIKICPWFQICPTEELFY